MAEQLVIRNGARQRAPLKPPFGSVRARHLGAVDAKADIIAK